MQELELVFLAFHACGTNRRLLTLCVFDPLKRVIRVAEDEVVGRVALHVALNVVLPLRCHATSSFFLYVFLDYTVFLGDLGRADLYALDPARVWQALLQRLCLQIGLHNSILVLINDDLVVQEVLPLDNAVAKLNDQLHVFHDLRELEQSLFLARLRHIHHVQLVALQLLDNLENLIGLRSDPIEA